jgi:hypothetical protein
VRGVAGKEYPTFAVVIGYELPAYPWKDGEDLEVELSSNGTHDCRAHFRFIYDVL